MNKTKLVTNDTFVQMQASKLFYEHNILNNNEYDGYDILKNIDTEETIQCVRLSDIHYTFTERYNLAVNKLGVESLLQYVPNKVIEAVELKGLDKVDKHLNGIIKGSLFDYSFSAFKFYRTNRHLWLNKLGINHSLSSWTCLLKASVRVKYSK